MERRDQSHLGSFVRVYQKIKTTTWLPFFLIAVAVSLSYFNALENDFLWDDEFLIEKNSYLRSFENLPKMLVSNSTAGFGGRDNFYRPTQNIYYLFIYQAFGYNKVAFHFGNILLHFLNGILVFLLIFRLTKRKPLALLTSLLWVCHPTHVEAITYISGTADPMAFLFCFLCLLTYPYNKKHWGRLLASLAFFLLALLSKEAIIVTPALLVVCQFWLSKERPFHLKTYLKTLPFWLLAIGYLLVREFLLNFDKTYTFYKSSNIYTENIHYRFFTFLATLPEYLLILLRPIKLHMERSFPVFTQWSSSPVLLGALVVVLPLVLGIYLLVKKQKKWLLFAWLWFFAAFTPMTGVLIPVNSFILEHWLYLPSVGFFLVGALLVIKTQKIHPTLPLIFALILVSTEIGLTHYRNKVWRTPITFYQDILKYSEGSARVHNNLAMAYQDDKQHQRAIDHYKKAIALSDTYPQTHYNLARSYIQENRLDLALKHLNRSLELRPDFVYSQKLKKELLDFLDKPKKNP